MTQTKIYCDHCGKELDEMHDYPDIKIDTLDEFLKCDLCKACYEELGELICGFIHFDNHKKEN